jgi:hypothetical protein
MIAGVGDQPWVVILIDLKNIVLYQEWDNKQDSIFKSIYLENHVSHNEL